MKTLWQKFVRYFDPIDLTKGPVKKGILRFLGPIALSLLLQQIYTIVDSMIVGQTLGEAAVAAVNNATNIIFFVLYFAMGAASGFSVVVGELIGKKDDSNVRKCVVNQFYLCLIIDVLLTIFGLLAINPILGLLGIAPSATDMTANAVYENAFLYLLIIIGGTTTQLFYNQIVGTLRSFGDSFAPFLFLLGSTVLNICLDLLFIIVFRWGVAGAAIATVLAQGLAAIGCYIYAYIAYPNFRPKKEDFKWNNRIVIDSLKNGLPMAFSYSVLAIGVLVMQGAIDRFDITPSNEAIEGLPAQLGYGVGCKMINFLMAPLNALGTAMISFHSQNLGAKDQKRIQEGFKASLLIGLILSLALTTIGLLLTINGAYQYFFLSKDKISEATIRYGNTYLYSSVPFLIILMLLFIFRNTLQGLEKPLFTFIAGASELVARILTCLFLPLLFTNFAPTNAASPFIAFVAVCLGDAIAWVFSVIVTIIPTLRGVYTKENKENIEKLTAKP